MDVGEDTFPLQLAKVVDGVAFAGPEHGARLGLDAARASPETSRATEFAGRSFPAEGNGLVDEVGELALVFRLPDRPLQAAGALVPDRFRF